MSGNQPSELATTRNKLSPVISQGLPCFPCHVDKKPATPRGYKNATSNPDAVYELWRRYPGPLIGVPTGEISGLAKTVRHSARTVTERTKLLISA